MNIFIGNLPYKIEESELREMFEDYGELTSLKIITDRQTGQSKGFGFAEMTDDESALKAIEDINGAEIYGRNIVVKVAEPKPEGAARKPLGVIAAGIKAAAMAIRVVIIKIVNLYSIFLCLLRSCLFLPYKFHISFSGFLQSINNNLSPCPHIIKKPLLYWLLLLSPWCTLYGDQHIFLFV